MLLPDTEVVLLEPMARRVAFLEECVAALGLSNVAVRRGRAEDAAGQLVADVVVARAVAPMERLAGLAVGLVLAVKGAGAAEELSSAEPELRRLGVRDAAVVHAGSGRVDPAPAVIRLTAGHGSDRREAGTPAMPGGVHRDDGRR
jgi:16S rRNA (guanine527-N7)-methyltransferase